MQTHFSVSKTFLLDEQNFVSVSLWNTELISIVLFVFYQKPSVKVVWLIWLSELLLRSKWSRKQGVSIQKKVFFFTLFVLSCFVLLLLLLLLFVFAFCLVFCFIFVCDFFILFVGILLLLCLLNFVAFYGLYFFSAFYLFWFFFLLLHVVFCFAYCFYCFGVLQYVLLMWLYMTTSDVDR